ncbi:MAG TPA: DUF2156 domain-containing protein [Clostridiaceae bacterium]|nr:DUF2156 domain-containing protein [Clostridiaceae bacterium]
MDTFKSISFEEQDLFNEIFGRTKPVASEFTFAYLFMWRRDYNLSYAIIEDHLCLVSQSKAYKPYSFCPIPVGGEYDPPKFYRACRWIEEYFRDMGFQPMFARVSEGCLGRLIDVFGDRAEITPLENTFDYVYNASDLINLPGKKYSSKRNHIHQFMRKYGEYEYVPVSENNIQECKRIIDAWADLHETNTDPDHSERYACYELLDNWGKFQVKGALIKVNGRFEAFTIGELLNPETAVVRIEKANAEIHGLYTLINRDFCANEWSHVKYVNREEDLGIEGLRKSKLSYNPAFMVNKFLVKV